MSDPILFPVKANKQADYVLGMVDWLDGSLLHTSNSSATALDTGITVMASPPTGVNTATVTVTEKDGTTTSYLAQQAFVLWVTIGANVKDGDMLRVRVDLETTDATPRKDSFIVNFEVVDVYAEA